MSAFSPRVAVVLAELESAQQRSELLAVLAQAADVVVAEPRAASPQVFRVCNMRLLKPAQAPAALPRDDEARFEALLPQSPQRKPRVRSIEWLEDVVESIFEEESSDDDAFPVHVLRWLRRAFPSIAEQTGWDLLVSARAHRSRSPTVELFCRFLAQRYDRRDLAYLRHLRTTQHHHTSGHSDVEQRSASRHEDSAIDKDGDVSVLSLLDAFHRWNHAQQHHSEEEESASR